MADTLRFNFDAGSFGDQREYSAASSDDDDQTWLSGGYGATGVPNTVRGKVSNTRAAYAFNSDRQFWPLRDPTQAASTVGGVLPTGATNCTPFEVNRGRCEATTDRGDPIAKLRFRPRLDTLEHTNGKRWGWVSILNVVDPKPSDIIGTEIPRTQAWEVRQNLPCLNQPAGGFVSGCFPCSVAGGASGHCSVLLEGAGEAARGGGTEQQRQIAAAFPCPMSPLMLRLGEARVPHNIMTALGSKGGARDTPDANFYTCEYRSNAIQGETELGAFVDGFLTGEVAPCCAAAGGAGAGASSSSSSANPCWHVPHDADVPFQTGLPDDFAAGFLLNYAARMRMTEQGKLCAPEQEKLLSHINRAKANPSIDAYPNVNRALDVLAEAVLGVDGTIRDCAIARGRLAKVGPDGKVSWEEGPLWSLWGDLAGNPGEVSVVQTTENARLECGTGLQMRKLTVTQQPTCGGQPCGALTQYRFYDHTCEALFGTPPGRAACVARCTQTQQRTYNQCLSAFRDDAKCTGLVALERQTCEQRCVNNHPDYACSSNLCLTPNRCDPITGRCGPAG
jgi:hypothetical protein